GSLDGGDRDSMADAMFNEPILENGPLRIKACRHGRLMYLANDLYVGQSLDRYGEYSEGEVHLFEYAIKPGMVVLDIGANIGAHTVVFARTVGAGGMVLAFEPQRFLFQILCGNMALNRLANVRCHHAAVGREHGRITVPRLDYDAEENFGGLSLGHSDSDESVEAVTIDGLGLPACDFMKVDVEGMEGDVLTGAEQTVRRFRPTLYVENDRRDKSAQLIQQLMDLDYRLYWHRPRMFNPDNYFQQKPAENVAPSIVSPNMLGLHRSRSQEISGTQEITSPQDWWQQTPASPTETDER
ncbi:MAG: FkbM family methyltransferase, partial [Phycisphaerae bacterium]|nr:FkbM family methyltransferase [Phycisphaerae bacterium]